MWEAGLHRPGKVHFYKYCIDPYSSHFENSWIQVHTNGHFKEKLKHTYSMLLMVLASPYKSKESIYLWEINTFDW